MDLDMLDRQLMHALQLDARVPFSRIATVLGVSDQTVARRYARLKQGGVRVLGLHSPRRVGEVEWFVRARCTPDAAGPIAEALARRSDTSWVNLTSGGTEIVCSARSQSATGADLLLTRLPRTARVLDVAAQCLLHVYFGGPQSLVAKWGTLSPEQAAALTPPPAPPSEGVVRLDSADKALMAALGRDGRAGIDELAAATGIPPTTVRRRLDALLAGGVLYFDLDLDRRLLDQQVRVVLWLTVAPAELDAAGQALAEHPEIAFAAATTGRTNLFASAVLADVDGLYRYLTTRVAALPGVRDLESAPIVRSIKGAGNLV